MYANLAATLSLGAAMQGGFVAGVCVHVYADIQKKRDIPKHLNIKYAKYMKHEIIGHATHARIRVKRLWTTVKYD